MYESSTKETKWVCIQLACSRRPRAFGESHRWNIQAKFYNENFPLVYESDKIRDSLSWRSWCYFEAQVWKKDSSIVPSLFFSLFFCLASLAFFLPLFLFPHMGQCSNNDDHHTSIYLQIEKNYNSMLRTKYYSMWMPPVVYRDVQWIKSDMYERIMNGGFSTNTMSTTWSCKAIWQWWSMS